MTAKDMNPRRFTAYKSYIGTQERSGYVDNLTHEEARDEKRFPVGMQEDRFGKFIWKYGINGGAKI